MNTFKILLVEDNEGDILLTTEALHESKCFNSIAVVKDGWEAVQFLEHNGKYKDEATPDLVLLDVNLPKLNGHEVLKHIRSNKETAKVPVIMFTTSSSKNDIMLAQKFKANSYLTKPVDANDFVKMTVYIESFCIKMKNAHNK